MNKHNTKPPAETQLLNEIKELNNTVTKMSSDLIATQTAIITLLTNIAVSNATCGIDEPEMVKEALQEIIDDVIKPIFKMVSS